jgi:hypothetical protein
MVCVSRKWAGVDSVWEQKKLEARKMLVNAAESHTSDARFVGTLLTFEDSLPLKDFAILLLLPSTISISSPPAGLIY